MVRAEFLNREPSLSELRALQRKLSASMFPGCVRSLDCMHIRWKNYQSLGKDSITILRWQVANSGSRNYVRH